MEIDKTWDGLPIAREAPYGCAVVVYRRVAETNDVEFLLMHRHHHGAEYEGDWAWTPPSGARQPGEDITACARRELYEEAGLTLEPVLTGCGEDGWPVYIAEFNAADHVVVIIDPEHDRYEWVDGMTGINRISPLNVKQAFINAVEYIQQLVSGSY